MAPNFGPSCGGPARPTALRTPTPTSGAWFQAMPAVVVVAPAGARSGLRPPNTCLTGRAGGVVWGCATAPRVEPCRGATAARNALTKHGARVALGVDMGACPHTPSPLVSSRGGVPLLAVQASAGGPCPPGGLGVQPLPWSRHRRRAGRLLVQGAAPDQTKLRAAKHSAVLSFAKHPPNCSFSCQKVLA